MVSKVASPKSRKKSATSVAVFPGSFDPLTNGHVDIVERSIKIFDRVVIGVLDNPSKQGLFTPSERVALISKQFTRHEGRVEVMSFSGLLVEFAQRVGGRVIVRGLRAISDFDYEAQMALINRNLAPTVETFFLTAREENSYISSTVVKQVALLGGDVSTMVPPVVAKALKSKYLALRKDKPLIGPA
jgi:pantetheine-phosphate adenylyltransferase